MGNITSPNAIVTIIGLFAVSVMLIYKIRGALLYGILFATVIGAFLGVTKLDTLSASSFLTLPSFAPTFWQFDFSQVFTTDMLFVLTTFLFVDLFDTVGTLVGVATKGDLLDKDGRLPEAKQAFLADAMGTCIGAVLGTSAVTSYVESASGVAAGGRTGLTALVIAVFFFISLLLAPIFLLIPSAATAPALIVVGLFMISPIKEIDFDNFSVSIPVFITIIGMPLTYSIAHGIAWGVISYVIISISMGKFKEIHPLTYILALLFIAKFIIE